MGEHLPCKQGVKSSNLSISTGGFYKPPHTYLENRILKTISKKKRFLKEGENRKKGTEYSKTSEELREERSKTNREKQETDKAIEPNPLKKREEKGATLCTEG